MDGSQKTSSTDLDLTEALEARLDALAEVDIVAGRVVPHQRVVEWLRSWGTTNEVLRPDV